MMISSDVRNRYALRRIADTPRPVIAESENIHAKRGTVVVPGCDYFIIMILPNWVQRKRVQVPSGLLTITTDDFNWRKMVPCQ